jgi:cysteinyl-tRNA synthetase
MPTLRLFNTLGRELQEFKPISTGKVGFYGCGPTVYDYAHIGNLRAYVFDDTLVRALRFLGYEVTHVMNITDVGHLSGDLDTGDDVMLKRAQERGKTPYEIADFYTEAFFKDTGRLNVLRPSVVCKATDHVADMIALIERIEARGFTYQAGGNLYFDVSKFPSYGDLALLKQGELKAGARIEIDPNKRNPADFALWFTKSKFENQAMIWDSPWGRGYPGWHIECSAMSMKYLGEQFDIHCGGIDHIPVHHTNEIAQSEGATNKKPWVRYWCHCNFLKIDPLAGLTIINNSHQCPNCGEMNLIKSKSEYALKDVGDGTLLMVKCKKCKKEFSGGIKVGKMSKSGDNFLRIQTLLDKGFSALDYRYFCLQSHYRKELTFSWEALNAAKNGLNNLYKEAAKFIPFNMMGKSENEYFKNVKDITLEKWRNDFQEAICDDLDIPRALAIVWELLRSMETYGAKALLIKDFDRVLGLNIYENAEIIFNKQERPTWTVEIEKLKEERDAARKAKDWKRSDELRAEIEKAGYLVKDTPKGTEIQPK